MCIGREFAMTEGVLALTMILQRYRITPGNGPLTEAKFGTSLKPKGGVTVKLVKRAS